MSGRVQLRPHQREAVAAGVDALSGTRHAAATIIAACGTGKTLIGKRVAEHFAARGPVLVLVPTLELLTQTAARWLADGGFDQLIGVCSLPGVHDRSLRGRLLLTADARVLARRVAEGGRIAVFATYASLPTIAEAHRGERLPPWAFALADEAHRTSGDWDKRWALIHDDRAIPAAHRLYMTATPRNWRTTPNPKARTRIERLASMDDPTIYGPVVYRLDLAEAIERGILADYQLIVPEVHDRMLRDILHDPLPTPHQDGLRLAAMQAALLMSMAEHDARRVLSFHGRIAAARGFVASLPETADVLADRTGIRNPWAHALHCHQAPWRRQQIFHEFEHFSAHTPGSTAGSHDCAVLASVRVLSEGVDAPDTDGILIADPRRSPNHIAQSIGRALRKPPGQAKCASIFIPVYIAPGQSTRQAMESSLGLLALLQRPRRLRHQGVPALRPLFESAATTPCTSPAPCPRDHPHPETAHPQGPQQRLLERRPAGSPGLPHPPPSPEHPQRTRHQRRLGPGPVDRPATLSLRRRRPAGRPHRRPHQHGTVLAASPRKLRTPPGPDHRLRRPPRHPRPGQERPRRRPPPGRLAGDHAPPRRHRPARPCPHRLPQRRRPLLEPTLEFALAVHLRADQTPSDHHHLAVHLPPPRQP